MGAALTLLVVESDGQTPRHPHRQGPLFHVMGRAIALLVTLALSLSAPSTAKGRELSYQVWVAAMSNNTVGQVIFLPHTISLSGSGLLGLALQRRLGPVLETGLGRLYFEGEVHMVRHFAGQRHWEFNLPFGIRLTTARRMLGLADSLAFGLGPSYATEPPPHEARPGVPNARFRVYFHIEAARQLSDANGTQLFLRVHHRSGVWGLVAPRGSSDAIAIGFRRRF
jgi:hypothetical protein